MSGNYTARSNFKTRSRNVNISEIFATKFGSPIALGTPTNFAPAIGTPGSKHVDNSSIVPTPPYPGTVTNFWSYVCDIPLNGNDAETGFAKPTGAPLYASVKYGVYVIDYYTGFVTNDMAGINAIAPVALVPVTIRGVPTTALSLTFKAVPDAVYNASIHNGTTGSNGFAQQIWYTVQRSFASSSELNPVGISFDFWVNNFTGKYAETRRRTTFFDCKSNTSAHGGSLRRACALIYANAADAAEFGVDVGTVGFEIIIDNDANYTASSGITIKEEFIRFKNYSITIPEESFFKFEAYWKFGSSYSDTTTGRFIVRIDTGTGWQTVADVYSTNVAAYEADHALQVQFPTAGAPHAQRNIHHGILGDSEKEIVDRIFIGQYSSRLNTDFTVMIANVSFKNGLTD